jgi:hypothetical protein
MKYCLQTKGTIITHYESFLKTIIQISHEFNIPKQKIKNLSGTIPVLIAQTKKNATIISFKSPRDH